MLDTQVHAKEHLELNLAEAAQAGDKLGYCAKSCRKRNCSFVSFFLLRQREQGKKGRNGKGEMVLKQRDPHFFWSSVLCALDENIQSEHKGHEFTVE